MSIIEPLWIHLDGPTKRSVRTCNRLFRALANEFTTRLTIREDELQEAHGMLPGLWPNVTKVSMLIRQGHSEAALALLNGLEAWKWTELCIEAHALDISMQEKMLDCLPLVAPHLHCLSLHGLSSGGDYSGGVIPSLKDLRYLNNLSLSLQGSQSTIDTGSLLWQDNHLTCLHAHAGIVRLTSGESLRGLASLSLMTRPSANGPAMPPDTWRSLTGLTKLHASSNIRINPETLPVLLDLPLLEDLSVLGLAHIPQRHHLSELGATAPSGSRRLNRLRLLAYAECCAPDALIGLLSWTGMGTEPRDPEPPLGDASNDPAGRLTCVTIEHLRFRVTRLGPEQASLGRLLDAGSTTLAIDRVIDLDLIMLPNSSETGIDSFFQQVLERKMLPTSLSALAKLKGLSLGSFHLSESYAARLAAAVPGIRCLTLNECWLRPGALNELHSITGLSHVKATSCLGDGVRPMFLVSFLANSQNPLHLHVGVGHQGGSSEEDVAAEMEEVTELLRGLRPDASFSWDWFDG